MLILDCDTGRDDALAILYAVLRDLGLQAVFTSYGNTELANVTKNTLGVLDLVGDKGQQVKVIEGCSSAIQSHRYLEEIVRPRMAISGNGLCNIDLPTTNDGRLIKADVEWLAAAQEFFLNLKAPVEYVVTGPCSNFAFMLNAFPDLIRDRVKSLTVMGGKLGALWDRQPTADFNFAADPHAVDVILSSNIPVRMITIDVSSEVFIDLQAIESFTPPTDIGKFCCELMQRHLTQFAKENLFKFHDPLTVLALDGWGEFRKAKVKIDTSENGDFGRLLECADGRSIELFHIASDQKDSIINHLLKTLTVI